jgi:hypothetical protein
MSEECLNAHDKSRVKVLLELSEAKARIEELETALDAIKTKLFLTTLPCDHCDLQCESAPCTCTDYPLIDGRDECLKICETALALMDEIEAGKE